VVGGVVGVGEGWWWVCEFVQFVGRGGVTEWWSVVLGGELCEKKRRSGERLFRMRSDARVSRTGIGH